MMPIGWLVSSQRLMIFPRQPNPYNMDEPITERIVEHDHYTIDRSRIIAGCSNARVMRQSWRISQSEIHQ